MVYKGHPAWLTQRFSYGESTLPQLPFKAYYVKLLLAFDDILLGIRVESLKTQTR